MRLEVVGLKRYFDAVKAVDDLSFAVEGGKIYGFVGPNGAGKTTTLRILATLDEPTDGDALLDGRSLVQEPEWARRAIGFMPDHLPTHRDVSVHDYLDFFARAYGLRGSSRRRTTAGIEEFTGLTGIRRKLIHTLSKGMKQRLSLARALIHDPGILLLDEPAAGLDPRARVELRELLLVLAEQGKAVLISSHILTELSEICHGAVILEQGRMMRAGSIGELLRESNRHMVIRIRGLGDAGALHKTLLTTPGVEAVRPAGEGFDAEIAGGEEAVATVLGQLVASGQRIVELRPRSGGLEEVFLSVTRGEMR